MYLFINISIYLSLYLIIYANKAVLSSIIAKDVLEPNDFKLLRAVETGQSGPDTFNSVYQTQGSVQSAVTIYHYNLYFLETRQRFISYGILKFK